MRKSGLSENMGVGNVRVILWKKKKRRVKLRSIVVRKKLVLNPASVQSSNKYLLSTIYARLPRCGTTRMTKSDIPFLIGEKDTTIIGPVVISAIEKIKWGKELESEEMGVGGVN